MDILRRRPVQIGLGLLIVAIVAIAAFILTRDDAPDAVDADTAAEIAREAAAETSTTTADAAESTDDTTASTDDTAAETTEAAPAGVDGTWTVDNTIGEFSFEEATSSFAGFRIDEVLAGGIDVVAVGRTPTVSGTITIEGTTLTATEIVANLDDISTNDSRRDNAARRAMNTGEFPEATFSLTSPVELGDGAANGDQIAVAAAGDLTINGITQPVTIDITAQLVADIVVVTGSTTITFADWNVDTPSAPIVASLDDFGILEMQLFFRR